jgi:chemotaxis protein methyltransferase CheR
MSCIWQSWLRFKEENVPPPSEKQFCDFYRRFNSVAGIDFNQYKQDQLTRRMVMLVEQRKLKTFEELTDLVLKDREAREWFLDRLAINVTEVFRNPEHWVFLEQFIKDDLLKAGKPLKVWSAGCSTGAEAYSLASILDVHSPRKPHRIVCTDIDAAAMQQAKDGVLFGTEFRDVPKEYQKYFSRTPRGAAVSDELKKYMTFQRHNLLADSYGTGYDLIVCRNVLIYFVEEAKEQIFRRFFDALRPGGYLFIGGSERIFNPKGIGFECPRPYFYQKPSEEKKWLNAS